MTQNHLKLNISKTKFMVFSPRFNLSPPKISPKLENEQEIEQVSQYKYLGLILDLVGNSIFHLCVINYLDRLEFYLKFDILLIRKHFFL